MKNDMRTLANGGGIGIGRRGALLLPLALGGCSWFDHLFDSDKVPLPGHRETVLLPQNGLAIDAGVGGVTLPAPVANVDWAQAGGLPTHALGNLAAGNRLTSAWGADIGAGGGYRRKILSEPVVANGLIYTMDSDAVVTAFSTRTGAQVWRADSKDDNDDSTNIGGGLAVDNGLLYAVNGLAWLVAMDARTGRRKYRKSVKSPTRSGPTVVDGKVYFTTIDDMLLAHAADDGHQIWSYQAQSNNAAVLGQPAPACAGGLVVAGFGSGELAGLRADTGDVAWTDSLGSSRGHGSVFDIASIRGLPVIDNGRVFAIGTGGLMVALDLLSGRRIWEREVAGENSLCVAGDWLFLNSVDQILAAVNVNDGRVAWTSALPHYLNAEKLSDPIAWYGPVLGNGRLLLASTTQTLMSLDPTTGRTVGKVDLGAPAAFRPIIAGGVVYVVTDDGRLQAFR